MHDIKVPELQNILVKVSIIASTVTTVFICAEAVIRVISVIPGLIGIFKKKRIGFIKNK